MKLFFKMAAAAILLLFVSCDIEDLPDGTIIFYNFSPVTITELKVYDSSVTGQGHYGNVYTKRNLVYTYAGEIKAAKLHQFVLPGGVEYFFEVKTEEGETYEGGHFETFGTMNVIFSVDYDVLEYDT
jgi:hypothetical protein